MEEKKILTEEEKQASVPYFIHEGDMTRMDIAMDKLQKTCAEAMQRAETANKHMRDAVRIVCVTLILVVVAFVIGYTINNNNWIRYAETLQAEGAGHGDQQTEIHELPDPGIDP